MFSKKLCSLLVVGAAMSLTALPATAVTYVQDYEIITLETAINSNMQKQLIITCPAGKRALGAGWAALDETGAFISGQALASMPQWDGSGWLFNIRVNDYHPSWMVRGRVTCAKVASR